METLENFEKNFDNIYYNSVVNNLAPLEKERKIVLRNCILSVIAGLILIVVSVYFLGSVDNKLLDNINALVFIVGVIFLFLPGTFAKNFEDLVKERVMPIVLKSLSGFRWSSTNNITDNYIEKSRLATDFNRRYDDDNFKGTYKNVKIDICETELGKETGSGKNRSYTIRFKGVLVKLVPERKYKGMTLIRKQRNIFGTPPGLEKVNLEDVVFEKMFNVYSDDQIEARYVLTTAFMERFKNIELAFKASKIEASISSQGILIGISTGRDLFKLAKVYRPVCDYELFKRMAQEFASILELVDELKLYQDIGL